MFVSVCQGTEPSIAVAYWCKLWNITNKKFQGVFAHPTSYDVETEVWLDA